MQKDKMEKMTKNNPKILTHFLTRKVFVQTLIKYVMKIEVGIDQQNEANIVGLRHATAQRQRFTDPGFAGQQDEPAPFPDTVQNVGEGGVEVGVPIECFWVI
jgi:hypothetical protein